MFEFPGKGHQATDETDPDSAEALVKKYTQSQQGLRDWAVGAVQRYADVIRLALADPLPVEESLRRELGAAGKRFNLSPVQAWRVLQKHYRESDAHIHALAEEFVAKWEVELQEANDRQRLGEIDDEEDIDDRVGEAEPESVKIRVKTKEFIAAIREETGRDESEIKAQLRSVMRDHPDIGEISADPPGAQIWKRPYGHQFRVTPRGVFARVAAGLFDWERICKTPLVPFAHSSMHLTDTDPRVHLNVLTYDGKIQREIEISREKISVKSISAAIRELTRFNVYVVRNDFARSEIVELLNFKPKGCRIVRTKTTGWLKLDADYCFVLPLAPPELAPLMPKRKGALVNKRATAKPRPEIIARLDTAIRDVGQKFGFDVSGTVQEWQDAAARPLEGCSNVALALGVGLAAPLLHFADEQPGGFHDYGPSTIGKSCAGAVGESIYGRPSATTKNLKVEAFGTSWATASDVGIVAFAQMRSDVGLFLDELGKARSVKKQIPETIYTLSSGMPKLRADSQGRHRPQEGFSGLTFSTGEEPLRTFLEKMDDTEGRKKRFVDVPALVGDMTALEKFSHVQIGDVGPQIYSIAARVHGAVGQAWLRYLVDLGEAEIKAKLDQYRKAWLALPEIVKLIHHDPKDDSVIRRFALLAAALRLAIGAQLCPWSVESSDRGIVACCLRWAADKDSSMTTLEQKAAEQKLREAILDARAANRLIVLNKQPGKGGGLFVPAAEHAVMFEGLEAFKKAGTLLGFIKVDDTGTRILLDPDTFRKLSAGCGLEHNVFVDYLVNRRLLEIKNEKVKGKTDQYYVLGGKFLHSEATPT